MPNEQPTAPHDDRDTDDHRTYAKLIKQRLPPVFGPSFEAYKENPKPPRGKP